MSKNNKYVDIYSHSGAARLSQKVENKRNVKSSRALKCVLCFLFVLLCCLFSAASYIMGAYVSSEKFKAATEDSSSQMQSSISVVQGSAAKGLEDAIASVVGICVYNDRYSEFASGAVISDDGYIITNDHIFKSVSNPKIKVCLSNREYYDAAFIGADSKYDIAVVKIECLNLNKIDIATSVSVGEQVYCIGSPMNETLSSSVFQGIVSGINRRIGTLTNEYSPRLIQTDAAINPGNSGGVLVNFNGQVIGICCCKVSDADYENIGFAIPIDKALSIANELMESGAISGRAKLGISYTAVDYIQSLTTNKACGIRIESIDVLSDLYGKGFGSGDTITSINGKEIKCEDNFLTVVEQLKPNDKVILSITTDSGNYREIEVILMEEKPSFSYR